MNNRPIIVLLAAGAMAAASPFAARAGVIITQQFKHTDTHKVEKTTTYIDGNRMAARSDDGTGMIFDGDRQVTWSYDTRHKMYTKMTAAEAKAMVAHSKAVADKMMRDELKHMSPKMRKLVEAEMLKSKKGPTYKRVGAPRKVGQWRCTPVAKFSSDGEKQDTMCVASFEELGITAGDQAVFKALNRFMEGMDCDSCSSSGPLSGRAERQLGFRGMPVEERDPAFGVTTVTSIRHGSVPASVFQLPKGLKQRSLSGR
ncbi:MAG: hypothetical protein P8076_11055 [Gammaproteobacteria bacterium]